MPLFQKNLVAKGRLLRAGVAVATLAAAFLLWPHSHVAAVALAMASTFAAFEAARGWCLLRACGLKTRF